MNDRVFTLRDVCRCYFDKSQHQGCPFKEVCLVENRHPDSSARLVIANWATAAALRDMADLIDILAKPSATIDCLVKPSEIVEACSNEPL